MLAPLYAALQRYEVVAPLHEPEFEFGYVPYRLTDLSNPVPGIVNDVRIAKHVGIDKTQRPRKLMFRFRRVIGPGKFLHR